MTYDLAILSLLPPPFGNSASNRKKIMRSIRKKSLVVHARPPPMCRFTTSGFGIRAGEICGDGSYGFPLRLLSWGNLISSVYELFDNPEYAQEPIVKALKQNGLRALVRTLSHKLPNGLSTWLIRFDNTFNDGQQDSVPEWIEIMQQLWPDWLRYRASQMKRLS